jgi:PEP-CTERM motif
MKKITVMLIVAFGLAIGSFGVASASSIPFTDTIDWDTLTLDGHTYDQFIQPNDKTAFTYQHDLTFDPEIASILSATLEITHRGNGASDSELWFVRTVGTTDIDKKKVGDLSYSNGIWATDVFTLAPKVYDDVIGSDWLLVVKIDDNTDSQDGFKMDYSTLSGQYAPVPEPGTLLLLGSGLAGLALYRRRKAAK